MSEPFIGEIRLFPYNFAPVGWSRCDGQYVPVSQNAALYAVIGNTYGGDANNMQLPNLGGSVPMGVGNGPGLTPRALAETVGVAQVTLTANNLPPHRHGAQANITPGTTDAPGNSLLYGGDSDRNFIMYRESPDAGSIVPMSPNALQVSGGGHAHENRQPYLGIQFCIAMDGIFPPRS